MYPAKMAGPIELPFGMSGEVGPSNHVLDRDPDPPRERCNFVLDRDPDPPRERCNFGVGKERPTVTYRDNGPLALKRWLPRS